MPKRGSDGFTPASLGALAALMGVYVFVFIRWNHLIDWALGMDWLLAVIWITMTGLLVWNVDPKRDLPLVLVAACGGLVIEWWGTNTRLWEYFTRERPPPWIIPAWPVAAVAVDRLALMLDARLPSLPKGVLAAAYWTMVPAFVVGMGAFLWPSVHETSSKVVLALMVGVTLTPGALRRDVVLFFAGAGLGVFLEYWGTSRACWTYYTAQVPPPVAVVAHGFASLAFARGVALAGWATGLAPAAPQAAS
ncbi:MAG: hypothetical protein H6739_26430 [Alphaproteobacteria bacterium]|nr:hypothetical protein [Alphaproteobacteria bacterium]